MSHTAGDWVVQHEFDDEPSYVIVNPATDGTIIAELPVDEHIPWRERLANARLIAAAPTLHAFAQSRALRGDREAVKLLIAIGLHKSGNRGVTRSRLKPIKRRSAK